MADIKKELINKGCIKNCLEVRMENDAVQPIRFTNNQMKRYCCNPLYAIRANCPASVTIECLTNTTEFVLAYNVPHGFARDWIYFDIYINDCHVCSLGSQPIGNECSCICYTLPKTNQEFNKLTIYLPHTVGLTITNIKFSEGAKMTSMPQLKGNLLCLGDSITQGMDALYPSHIYPTQLGKYLNMNVLNQGVGGYYFNEAAIDESLPYQPDIITVAYGTNDWVRLNSKQKLKEKVQAYIKKLCSTYHNAQIFVITPLWRLNKDEVMALGRLDDVIQIIRQCCLPYANITVVDGYQLVPNMPTYFADGLHPTDEGVMHYSLNLAKAIMEAQKPQ